MRRPITLGLILMVAASALGEDRPIPQDAERMEKRARERLAWNRRTVVEAYKAVGKKDPRWNRPAIEALDLAARMFSQLGDPPILLADVQIPARRAVEAGCDDPMILYLHARSSGDAKPEEYRRRMRRAADAMAAGGYPPIRRATALLLAIEEKMAVEKPTPADREQVGRDVEAVINLLPLSVAQDPRGYDWEAGWDRILKAANSAYAWAEGDAKAGFDKLDARLVRINGVEALRLATKGAFLILWGWEARTNALAGGVSDKQFQTFEERLKLARAALEEAWRLNPDQPHVALRMLMIEKGIGQGDRQAMETWFERAMKADGNDREACWNKMDWLDPKWYGGDSTDDLLAFGRACWATKNWHNGLSLLVVDAHHRHLRSFPPERQVSSKYFSDPKIHEEIRIAFEDHLKHYPDDHAERSKYAFLCFLGGHADEAHRQFQLLGDNLTRWPNFPYTPLPVLKQIREKTASIAAAKKAGRLDPNP